MKYILFFVLFFVPILVKADVVISEVAWMGTSESQFEEWVELRNTGSESVSLSGWKLYKAGGETVLFSLSGEISAGAYFLVCRTTASVTNPLSGSCDTSGTFGGSGLNNASEYLILKNGSTTVDEVNATSGWPAGDASTKQTMQKNGSSWITGDGTPGASNITTGTGNEDDDDPPPSDDDDDEEEDVDEEESASSSSKASKDTRPTYTKKIVDIQVVDTSVPVGTPVKFSLTTRDLKGANIYKGDFFWNMGDGTERFFSKSEKFEHIYDHEGSYVVYVKYYSTYFEGMEPEVTDKVTVTVGNPSVVISKVHSDGSVEIKNTSSQEIDLSHWVLKDGLGKTFVIPEETYIVGNKTLVLNTKRIKLSPPNILLFSPSGSLASSGSALSITQSSVKTTSSSSSSSKSVAVAKEESVELTQGTTDLNDRLGAQALTATNQKQPSLWMIVFVALLVGSSVLVFFLYKKKQEKDVTEEDEFELID